MPLPLPTESLFQIYSDLPLQLSKQISPNLEKASAFLVLQDTIADILMLLFQSTGRIPMVTQSMRIGLFILLNRTGLRLIKIKNTIFKLIGIILKSWRAASCPI